MSSRGGPSDPVDRASMQRELELLCAAYARADRWAPVPEALDRAIAHDTLLAAAARRAREGLLEDVRARLSAFLPEALFLPYLDLLREVPRERFVLPEDLALSAVDSPLSLDRKGNSTISAPHAYLLTDGLLGLAAGDHLIEMGTGTGYGTALALAVVGPKGRVTSIEIDPTLAARARRLLALLGPWRPGQLTLLEGDATHLTENIVCAAPPLGPPLKIACTFALLAPPARLASSLPERAVLVAPVASSTTWPGGAEQDLVRWERKGGATHATYHGPVRYVTERH